MNRIAPDNGVPAHHETVLYMLRILHLVESGNMPDVDRLAEWQDHRAELVKCRNFDHPERQFLLKREHPHENGVEYWDKFIANLQSGKKQDEWDVRWARDAFRDIDRCMTKYEIHYSIWY